MDAAAGNDTPGDLIDGRYRLGAAIGAGGTARVWSATHEGTAQQVAVKILEPFLASEGVAVERFLREARAAARVRHPNVVEVVDVGIDAARGPYLVTELLTGETLESRLAAGSGPIALAEIARLTLGVLDALAVAHEAGIVHRDFKPANVLLHRDRDGRLVPKLLDFGICKDVHPQHRRSALTGPFTILGTPHYLSPEQTRCSRDVDARADVWSAGVLLYRMLVGHVPFDGENFITLADAVFSYEPPPPVLFGAAPPVSAIVMRCLEKNPRRRFADARALKSALCAALGLPESAGTAGRPPLASVPPLDHDAPTVRPPALGPPVPRPRAALVPARAAQPAQPAPTAPHGGLAPTTTLVDARGDTVPQAPLPAPVLRDTARPRVPRMGITPWG